MALRKTKQFKGVDCDYWKIIALTYDDIKDRAVVTVGLFATEATATAGANNYLLTEKIKLSGIKEIETPAEVQALNLGPRDLLKALLYAKMKEPVIVQRPVEATFEERRAEGFVQEFTEEDVNWFSDAEDA